MCRSLVAKALKELVSYFFSSSSSRYQVFTCVCVRVSYIFVLFVFWPHSTKWYAFGVIFVLVCLYQCLIRTRDLSSHSRHPFMFAFYRSIVVHKTVNVWCRVCHVSSFLSLITIEYMCAFFSSSGPLISHIEICWKSDFVFGGDIGYILIERISIVRIGLQ